MIFRAILRDLVADVEGAIAALFVDHQGEAVDAVGSLPEYDLKVIGAYQGIFVTQLEAVCTTLGYGRIDRMKIEWQESTILDAVVDDEYTVLLVLREGANEGLAWSRLARARDRIREEM